MEGIDSDSFLYHAYIENITDLGNLVNPKPKVIFLSPLNTIKELSKLGGFLVLSADISKVMVLDYQNLLS